MLLGVWLFRSPHLTQCLSPTTLVPLLLVAAVVVVGLSPTLTAIRQVHTLAIQVVAVRVRLVPLVTHHQGQAVMSTVVSIQIALLAIIVVGQPILLTHGVQSNQGATATVVAVVVGHTQGRLLLFTLVDLVQGDCK
jgi:hypothetical protein